MSLRTTFFIAIALIVAAGVYYVATQQNPLAPAASSSVSNAEDSAVRATVTEFGSKLKNVSLLAPDASAQIAAQYGSYASPELIAQWQADVAAAPGRQTSSPWPDRIEVAAVTPQGSAYSVAGTVVEVTSADQPSMPAATYPVSLTVEQRSGAWVITAFSKGPYDEPPARTSLEGTWECLPHKDTTGPQTAECAFGIAVGTAHYGINTSLMSSYPVDFPTGTRVRVEGVLASATQLSAEQKYNIVGIINATTITKL